MDGMKWWQSSVVYQIYPKSFKDTDGDGYGDIKGIIEKLPYLDFLGIDVIWLNPIYESPEVDNGYDISDYRRLSQRYGSMEEFEKLINASEAYGIKILLDLVVNHTSDQHYWFKEAKKSINNPYHDYYVWAKEPNALQSNFGGSAWEYVPEVDKYYLHFFAKEQPDLNWNNPNLRQEIYDMMNFWIDKGIAGFRMDVIDLIGKDPLRGIKENGPHLHQYLQEMHRNCFLSKDLMTVGETWGATPEIALLYSEPSRQELSMVFQFEQMALDKKEGGHRWDLAPLDLIALKNVLTKWQQALAGKGWNSLCWNNHDLPRIVSRWGDDSEMFRVRSAKMLAILLHGMQGTPYIYQGEEIGMTNPNFPQLEDYCDIETQYIIAERLANGEDPEQLLKVVQLKARDSGRTPMQWSSSKFAGFSDVEPWTKLSPNYKRLTVEAALEDKDSVFYTYKKLIQLRKMSETIRWGRFELVDAEHPQVFAYKRSFKDEVLYVICNFYKKETRLAIQLGNYDLLLSNYPDTVYKNNSFQLRPFEAMILKTVKKGD